MSVGAESSRKAPRPTASRLDVAGASFAADPSGALHWEEHDLLVVSDLHLEKGSSFAARGVLLPPYDTAATLAGLAEVVVRLRPKVVIALGDSFHDRTAPERLVAADRERVAALQSGRDWIWIAGNHDPVLPSALGGTVASEIEVGSVTFRHEPTGAPGEIAGHLHPKARVATRAGWLKRRCFVTDGMRAVMPAFGSFAGGLNVLDAAFAGVFRSAAFTVHVLGETRLHAIPVSRCR